MRASKKNALTYNSIYVFIFTHNPYFSLYINVKCVYICMHMFIHINMHVCLCEHTHIKLHCFQYTHPRICVYVCVCSGMIRSLIILTNQNEKVLQTPRDLSFNEYLTKVARGESRLERERRQKT